MEESLLFIRPKVEAELWVRLMRSLELSRCEAGILVKLLSADGGRNNSPSSSLLELSAADPPATEIDLTEKITDLGNLSGNFDFILSTVWKFNNFPATLILREINFG